MTHWEPSSEYQKVAEANRQFYAGAASLYEASETCVTDRRIQKRLEADLDQIITMFGRKPETIRALDACGGAGNVSLKLLNRGLDVTLADISPELLEIYRRKCADSGFAARNVCAEIGSFLSQTNQMFDLIVFSSALHHLENIERVLTLAFHRLQPEGLLYTVFDPTSRSQLHAATRLLLRLEYLTFKLLFQTRDLPAASLRRLSRLFSGVSASRKSDAVLSHATAGMLAEFHVENGIDDLALEAELGAVGFEVVWHQRYADCRFDLTRRLIERTGDSTAFKLLLRKPAQKPI